MSVSGDGFPFWLVGWVLCRYWMKCNDCKELFGWCTVMFLSITMSDFGIAKMMSLKYETYGGGL